MRASNVNAYYNPSSNNIVILPGIIVASFFDLAYNEATLHGGLGMVIGHEIGHATDPNGIHFDETGVLRQWLSDENMDTIARASVCFASQYTARAQARGILESGVQTVTEDIADNVGLQTALISLKHSLNVRSDALLSPEQATNFFLMYGQVWGVWSTASQERSQIENDVHATAQFRVNKAVRNSPDFLVLYTCETTKPACTLVA